MKANDKPSMICIMHPGVMNVPKGRPIPVERFLEEKPNQQFLKSNDKASCLYITTEHIPKDANQGFKFGRDPTTCDVILPEHSEEEFFIKMDPDSDLVVMKQSRGGPIRTFSRGLGVWLLQEGTATREQNQDSAYTIEFLRRHHKGMINKMNEHPEYTTYERYWLWNGRYNVAWDHEASELLVFTGKFD